MIVVDTSAFISLGFCDTIRYLLEEFDVHTTKVVIEELKEISEYDDKEGKIAENILRSKDKITKHKKVNEADFLQRKVDEGGGTCAVLAKNINADFLITDDIRAVPYLKNISLTKVVFSPIVLKTLVHKDVLNEREAKEKLKRLIKDRDWFETPIYEKSLELF